MNDTVKAVNVTRPKDLDHRLVRNNLGEISGSHDGEYEETVFWDTGPCSLVEVAPHFRGAYCLHL
jgi:hypothetical protein